MKSHELAKLLLDGPDLPVVMNGWGSEEGFTFEVTGAEVDATTFFGPAGHNDSRPKDHLGYPLPTECLALQHG